MTPLRVSVLLDLHEGDTVHNAASLGMWHRCIQCLTLTPLWVTPGDGRGDRCLDCYGKEEASR